MNRCKEVIPIILLVLSFLYVVKIICAPVELHKVFHYQSNASHLSLGKLIFYFDEVPEITVKKREHTEFMHEYVFSFSNATIVLQEVQDAIEEIKLGRYAYNLAINSNDANKILDVIFSFDIRDIGFVRQEFVAITGQKAVAFNFYNKHTLERLQKKETGPILQTTCNKRHPIICIDSGHGGKDTGAIGINGTKEKCVCLSLAKQVGDELKKNGLRVRYTRLSDEYISIEDRICFAQKKNVDLFISIHANASSNRLISGTETYCYNPIFSKTVYTTVENIDMSYLHLYQKKMFHKSFAFAQYVHEYLCDTLVTQNPYFCDRDIKHGSAQVLYAAEVPSILVEVGFISHPDEEKLLNSFVYQQSAARAIVRGIKDYIAST